MGALFDLEQVREDVKSRLAKYDVDAVLNIDSTLWREIIKCYSESMDSDKVNVVDNRYMRIETDKGFLLHISAQEFRQVWAVLPYARAITKYWEPCNTLAKELGFSSRNSATGNWLAVAAARRGQLARALSENPEFDARLKA